jgi:hypothetical protein
MLERRGFFMSRPRFQIGNTIGIGNTNAKKLSTPQPKISPHRTDLTKLWWSFNQGYAFRWFTMANGEKKMVRLHRLILSLKLNRELMHWEHCDHINGDRLDNRDENLRAVTSSQNRQNLHTRGIYRGAFWNKKRRKWLAYVTHNKKGIYCGCFDDREEAARVAAAKRKQLGFLESTCIH